jgi:GNAT superfamily N-acetyltransferase
MLNALRVPVDLEIRNGGVQVRRATPADLEPLMALLADDAVSASRGDLADPGDRATYLQALMGILASGSNDLLVAVDQAGVVVGAFQLTLIPGMSRRGATRLLVEAVRVRSELRSAGIGGAMMRWVTDVAAPQLGAGIVQLTSDRARVDAHRFYERLGFTQSHLGFKYAIDAGHVPA